MLLKEAENQTQNPMKPTISKFSIKGLHGYLDLELEIKDNKLVLVAENGLGKTTLVNILFYFLSGQWEKLNRYKFKSIEVYLNNLSIDLKRSEFVGLLQSSHILNEPNNLYKALKLFKKFSEDQDVAYFPQSSQELPVSQGTFKVSSDIFRFINEKSTSLPLIEFSDKEIKELNLIQEAKSSLEDELKDIQFIYLPTYRRIERELENIFPDNPEIHKFRERRKKKSPFEHNSNYIELVEFGMSDIKELLEDKCKELKNLFQNNLNKKITGSYLEDILSRKYLKASVSQTHIFNKDALSYILKRLDDSVLSKEGKESLVKFVENLKENTKISDEDKVNAYFVGKLFQIFEEQQRAEKDINRFIELCNSYLSDSKRVYYDNDQFEVKIELTHKDKKYPIEFEDLSSGEKQIVSLFSHLILSNRKFFIIIDEPELSLSVVWQEKLLPDIINNENFRGLIAVTHSPFIFKNELKAYTHSLDEFIQ